MKRLAFITGGARGIGQAIAQRLAADGLKVLVGDNSLDAAENCARALRSGGFEADSMPLDVTDEASVLSAFASIERQFGRLDALVNNAGVPGLQNGARVDVEHMTLATWDDTLRVNLTGPLLVSRAAIPLLRRGSEPSIVNVCSRAARGRTAAGMSAYAASKTALIGLSQVLAGELGPEGITVNCVAPSTIRTAMTEATSAGRPEYFDRMLEITTVGRLGRAEDVSNAVSFLCSQSARFITGTVIDVNGGSLMT